MLSRQPSQVDELADLIGEALRERGETLNSMLAVLREERDRIFGERYPEVGEVPDREDEDGREPRP